MRVSFAAVRPIYVAIAAFLGSVAFILAMLAPQGLDPDALVGVGETFADAAAVPPSLNVIRDGDGHDGQFFYRLALDPFTSDRAAEGIALDLPSYRQQRILYPLIAWTLSLGRSSPVPVALLLINVATFTALAWQCTRYATQFKRPALLGLAVAALPPFWLALGGNLSEVLAATLLVTAVLSLQRPIIGAIALTLAVLTHEHAAVLAVAIALASLTASRSRARGEWLIWVLPLAAFLAWQVRLAIVWGEAPIHVAMGYISGPFRGFLTTSRYLLPPRTISELLHLVSYGYVLVFTLVTLWSLRTTLAPRPIALAWLLSTAVLFMAAGPVWESEPAVWRAAAIPLLLGALVMIASRVALAIPIVVTGGMLGALIAARVVWIALH